MIKVPENGANKLSGGKAAPNRFGILSAQWWDRKSVNRIMTQDQNPNETQDAREWACLWLWWRDGRAPCLCYWCGRGDVWESLFSNIWRDLLANVTLYFRHCFWSSIWILLSVMSDWFFIVQQLVMIRFYFIVVRKSPPPTPPATKRTICIDNG